MSKKEQISGIIICLIILAWVVLATFGVVYNNYKINKLETRIEELELTIDDLLDDLDDEFYFKDKDISELQDQIRELKDNQVTILKGKVIDYIITPNGDLIPKIELEDGTIAYLPITNKAVEIGKEVYIIGIKDKYVFIEVEK